MKNAFGKDAGEEKGMIADVGAQEKTGAFIRRLEGLDHFEEIIQRITPAGDDAPGAAGFSRVRIAILRG